MSQWAGAFAVAAIAMSLAYCTTESLKTQKDEKMERARFCSQEGGQYDFGWGSCNYGAKK